MKVGFIFVLYKTPKNEIKRLIDEVKNLNLKDYSIYFIDNSYNKKGYGYGVNQGIKKAIKDNCQLFFIANPDISIKSFKDKNFLEGLDYFNVLGFTCKQENYFFYGGEIDRWRLSGGLIKVKPNKRFQSTDFVSGSLMIVKKSVVDRIGFFDESYFMYYEEVDFCYRAKKAGFKIGIDSSFIYEHFEISKLNPLKERWLFLSHYRFFLKYSNLIQKIRELLRLPKTIFEQIKKRSFYLNFFSLNLFSFINKILSFLVFLILINNLKPDIFGIYTLAWAHISLFTPVLDFGTTVYGLINLDSSENKKDINSLITSRLFLGFLGFIISNLFAILLYFNLKDILIPIFLLSIVFFSNSLSGSFLIYSSINQKSYLHGLFNLIFQIILTLMTFLFFFINKKLLFLFYLYFIFYSLYGIFYGFLLFKKLKINFINFNLTDFLKLIKSSFVFLIINLLAGWYSKLDIFLLNFLKNLHQVGIYSSATKFLDGLLFISVAYNLSSISSYSQLIKKKQTDILKNKIKKDLILLVLIGLFISFLIVFFGQLIFLIIKKDYYLALPVLKIIIFNLPLILISSIAINVIYVYKKQWYIVYLFIFQLLTNGLLNWFFIPKYGYLASSWLSVLGWLLNSIILWLIANSLINKKNNILKISVDGGALDKNHYYGTKTFSENLIKSLLTRDKKNQYIIYRLNKINFLNFFWLKIQLSLREFFNKKNYFLALNQAIPFYVSGKIISFCHGLSYYFYPQFYDKKILKKLNQQLKEMIIRSDKIIVSSRKIKKELLSITQKIEKKIIFIPFGIPYDLLDFLEQNKNVKRKKNIFLVVANNNKIKNLNFIKNVYSKIKKIKKFKDFKLKIINNENNRYKLFELYKKSYCLLSASFYESFNFPIIEALICGCPVIALESAVIPELKKYVNIAKNEDEFISLTKKIKVIPSVQTINELKNKFSWHKYSKKIVKLYKNI